MTKKSNVYIGQGRRNNIRVMKIGKANNIKRREKQLGITIEKFSACITEAAAFQLERQLRAFIRQQGGIHYQKTLDWFQFNARIYSMMLTFLDEEFHSPKTTQKTIHDTDLTEEEEIRLFKAKYLELLREEIKTTRERTHLLRQEANQLRQKLKEENRKYHEENIKLHRQIARLELRLELIEEQRNNK